eukprot:NODE_1602_length_1444_cov_11.334852_g1366_i1.p1 GENE.NODE_1602_length_1444_cov_11.334852_g1366_i1~~NODE_1602_length_1444_cov_11.334852_g1366_i1.p1  ORF type:complete len:457 (-),score=132.03 NODE_1602_length_1444_cov_11.334852_g1366_i1:72-1442(-)
MLVPTAPLIHKCGSTNFLFRPTPAHCLSDVEMWRLKYQPRLPKSLKGEVAWHAGASSQCRQRRDIPVIQDRFPNTYGLPLVELSQGSTAVEEKQLRVGIVFCGRQTPGAHNVICGLHKAVTGLNGAVLGFVGGTKGLLAGQVADIAPHLSTYLNTGGMDLLGRTVDKLDPSDTPKVLEVAHQFNLSALVLVGSSRTQSNAARLAEALHAVPGAPVIIGVPTGIDGALHGGGVEASIGFDSACHMYSQLVGNTSTDAASAIQLSQIETERLLADLVETELKQRKQAGLSSAKFNPVCSFMGYQARGAMPSNFDCDLAYTLGFTAAHLAAHKLNGYLAVATGLKAPTEEWAVGGLPLPSLLVLEEDRHSSPQIPSSRIDLGGKLHRALRSGTTCDARPAVLTIKDDPGYLQRMGRVQQQLAEVREACKPGCPAPLLEIAAQSLATLSDVFGMYHGQMK